ncbi:ROK family protein [Microbacterium sp. NPDC056044]|uniref:ROK family transcriptional regulator n=1 Tax=Microbacterium sp. NPDC056044 TaxID=3345690 RepID=UPI0035D9172D
MTISPAPHRDRLLRLDHTAMRTHNLGLVLRAVRARPGVSRAEIAATTGLTKAAVGILVGELMASSLITEREPAAHLRGRPAARLYIDGAHLLGLAVEVNLHGAGLLVRLTARDLDGTEVFVGEMETVRHDVDSAVALVSDLVSRATELAVKTGRKLIGLELAVPALVDKAGQVVINAPGLGWREVHLQQALRESMPEVALPIGINNLATYSAIAEAEDAYRDTGNLVHLELGTGIGAGIVVDHQLLRGRAGVVGIIGHVQLDPAGPTCTCGRTGCFEAFAGLSALLATASGRCGRTLSRVEDVRAALLTSELTAADLEPVSFAIGAGTAILINLLGPDVLVLGGYMSDLAEWLLPPVVDIARKRVLVPDLGGTRIDLSPFGHESVLLGATSRIASRVLSDPTLVMNADL